MNLLIIDHKLVYADEPEAGRAGKTERELRAMFDHWLHDWAPLVSVGHREDLYNAFLFGRSTRDVA